MKIPPLNRTLQALTVAVALVLSGAVVAGGGADKIEKMDRNQDGMVTADEYLAHARMEFVRTDIDRDGTITNEEMDAANQPRIGVTTASKEMTGVPIPDRDVWAATRNRMMGKMDDNTDGRVSAEEHAAYHAEKFAKMDADSDGNLTAAEIGAGDHDRQKRMGDM